MLYILSLRGLPPEIIFTLILAYFLAICVAISFHEYAHSLTAYKWGDVTPKAYGRLTLNPLAHISGFGLLSFFLIGLGWAKPVKINPNNFRNYKKGMVTVSLSGVLTNLFLAFLFSGLLCLFISIGLNTSNLILLLLYNFVEISIFLNIALFLFNLLPIYPLDGFNFLSTFLRYDNKFIQFMYKYGMFFLILAIIPIFNGHSLLQLFYSEVVVWILNVFLSFWLLFF
ncbi:MAG: site-2 protease family protein [Clostridia bacterium]|nr:site-2 protease family protein [Clostridia bacterium]MDD4686233.1 site-2 protease family protein [Clostridia bacterium]